MKILVPIICAIAIAVAVFIKGCGSGGLGFGGNGESDTESVNNSTEQITDSTTTQVACIEITISGAEYIYQGKAITVDTLLEKAKKSNAEIRIYTDKTATMNALDNLEDALKENNLTHHIGNQ